MIQKRFKFKKTKLSSVLISMTLIFIMLVFMQKAYSATILLKYEHPSSGEEHVDGYRAYWGSSTGNYQASKDCLKELTCTISDLEEDQTYYFAATSYNSTSESDYSVEISYYIPSSSPPNNPLVAEDLSFTTEEGTDIKNVLSASDGDGDTLNYILVDPASKGTVIINNSISGTFTYTPFVEAIGSDTFTYKANDSIADSNVATVTITIEPSSSPSNDTPVADDLSFTTEEGTDIKNILSASDGDGGMLNYILVDPASKGTVIISDNGTFTYSPFVDATGTDTFTYKANDSIADSNVATVTITIETELVDIVIEAEDYSLINPPMEVGFNENDPFSQYIWVPQGNGDVLDPSIDSGFAKYSFEVPKTGTYTIWGNVNIQETGSFFIKVSEENSNSSPPTQSIIGLTPTNYQVGTLDEGEIYYIDRSFTITTMPSDLQGLVAIKTANSNKTNNQQDLLKFYITTGAAVYIAYDSRTTSYPDWLTADFIETGDVIKTTDVTFTIWKKDFPAGTVTFPGNQFGNPSGVGSNYFVLIDFNEDSIPLNGDDFYLWNNESALPQEWIWSQVNNGDTAVPIHFSLELGIPYELVIKHCEEATKIDIILITNSLDSIPEGL